MERKNDAKIISTRGTSNTMLKSLMYPKRTCRYHRFIQRALFIDPGLVGTGYAYYPELYLSGNKAHFEPPVRFGNVYPKKRSRWELKSQELCAWFDGFTNGIKPNVVIIEFPELWVNSTKSFTATVKGDLFKLTYLIGGMGDIVRRNGVYNLVLVTPMEWKGQLPKKVVESRIKKRFPKLENVDDHSADAIGMGMAAQGIL